MSVAKLPGLCASREVQSPLGSILLGASSKGLAGCWFSQQKHHPDSLFLTHASRLEQERALKHLDAAENALLRYWSRDVDALSNVPLDLLGTEFQARVWQALRRIVAGTSVQYGQIARNIGAPKASRAVGAAVGRNPLSLFVPCHRVLGQNGSLTGYAGGLERKNKLLQLEGALSSHESPAEPSLKRLKKDTKKPA